MAKTSKFRHSRAQVAKPDTHFINMSPTSAIWDCGNFMACNSLYVAVPWNQNGSTAVFRHNQHGKLPNIVPILTGHSAPVIDLTFSPFDDSLLFTASEDSTIRGWKIPDGGLTSNDTPSIIELKGHSKKVGILAFNSSASNVLASAGMDNVVNLWDTEVQQAKISMKPYQEQILSLNWNIDGSLINTTTRDKKVNILDSRTGNIVASADSHQGSKNQRSVWAKRKNMLITVGFDKSQRREVMVWDCRSLAKPIHSEEIDQSSSVMMPFYDEDTSMLFVGSKGDGSIKYYEVCSEAPHLLPCATYTSPDPAKGLCMMPKRSLDVKQCEVSRFYFLTANKTMYPVRMILPRKQAEVEFQEDVFVPTFASEPAISASEFFEGKNAEPKLTDLRGLFDGTELTTKPSVVFASPVVASPTVDNSAVEAKEKEVNEARAKVDAVRGELALAEEELKKREAELEFLKSDKKAAPKEEEKAEPAPAASS